MLELKQSPYLWGFYGLLVVVVGALIFHGDVTFGEAAAVFLAAIGAPAIVGLKKTPVPPPSVLPPPFSPMVPRDSQADFEELAKELGGSTFPKEDKHD